MKGHQDLLPCPFCGDEEVEIESRHGIKYAARCWGCGAEIEQNNPEHAKMAWNKRASHTAAVSEGGKP